jgi:hypothetical protein
MMLEHRAEKWEPVFIYKRCENKYLDRMFVVRKWPAPEVS